MGSLKSPVEFRTRFSVIGTKKFCEVLTSDDPKDRRTKQEFKDDCDINRVMARYQKTGILPDSGRAAAARYGDFSQIPDFMQMQEKIIAANELFAALPAAVRKQFDNDPGQFIAASETQEGRELMVKLGLGKEPLEGALQPSQKAAPSAPGQGAFPAAQTPPAPSKGAPESSSDDKSGKGQS